MEKIKKEPAYISDMQAERMIGLEFGELSRARLDVEGGAVIRYDNNGLSYGMDTYGLFWLELDLNRYRYSMGCINKVLKERRRKTKKTACGKTK